MNVPDLLARAGEWIATVALDADGRVVVRECSDHHVPPKLLEELRVHKVELGAWLQWEKDAALLWRSTFGRLSDRADLVDDPRFQALDSEAEAAHLRHDRAALVDALSRLEEYARERSL